MCFTKINTKDVFYIESIKNYAKIYTEKKVYMVLVSLKLFEQKLSDYKDFCRIHRSFIVSVSKIDSFEYENVSITFREAKIQLPLGEVYKGNLTKSVNIIARSEFFLEAPATKLEEPLVLEG